MKMLSTDLCERRAKFNKWHRRKRPLGIHLQWSGTKTVQIAHDNQKVGRRLYRQEPASWNIYSCQPTNRYSTYSPCPTNANAQKNALFDWLVGV